MTGHVANAWEEDGKVHIQVSLTKVNGFGFFPDKNGQAPRMEEVPINLNEWTIDPHSKRLVLPEPEQIITETNEFPRIDDRLFGQKNRVLFGMLMDFAPGVTDWEFSTPRMGCKFRIKSLAELRAPQKLKLTSFSRNHTHEYPL